MSEIISKNPSKEERRLIHFKKQKRLLIYAWVGFALIMLTMIPMWVFNFHIGGQKFSAIFLLIVSTYIVCIPGAQVLKSGWNSMRFLTPNMHVLTSIGSLAALSTGVLSVLHSFGLFVEIGNFAGLAGMIMSFHLAGSFIEQSLKMKATKSIKALVSLRSKHATVIRNNKALSIPIAEVIVGDVVIVKTGEKIPSDGEIIEGEGEINESLITGESTTVYKKVGNKVIGGSINVDGYLLVKIEKMGKQTFLQQVISLVEQAQGTKPQIQLIADKITAIFVPAILLISAFSFLAWYIFYQKMYVITKTITSLLNLQLPWMEYSPLITAIITSIAVLVVACPCALGLATPSAIAIGVGRGSQFGALIKNPTVFEKLKHADYIAMDKTGTITKGIPSLVDCYVLPEYELKEMLYYAASVEATSHHPLAQAVINYYKVLANTDIIPKATKSKTLQGKGLWGKVDNNNVTIGNMQYLQESNLVLPRDIQSQLQLFSEKRYTISAVILNDNIIGIMGFMDEPKEDSRAAIAMLHKMKFSTIMITGDNESAAKHIALQMNIKRVIAQAQPKKKLEIVQELQSQGHHVVMVGDGINDAPALTQAHIGVAMGTGTDVAAEAGDIILINGTLPTIVSSLLLSRKTYRIITQNLFWAFFYNLLLIPLAILGLVHPILAEIAMGFSSISVLLNSIRLSRFKPI